MTDIHNRQKYLDNTIQSLKTLEDLSDHNTDLILDFRDHLLAEGVSVERTSRYMTTWKTLAPLISFKLDEADKKDLKRLVGKINQNRVNDKEYSVWTLAEFKKGIRKFYQFVENEEEPEIIDFVNVGVKKSDKPKTDPDELPGPEEVKKLLQAASNKRDEALIFLTWDTGGRIGEILNLKWKDIKFGDELTQVRFRESKTGERRVPIRESVETLKEWKDQHPKSGDPESPVFITLKGYKSTNRHDQMPYGTANTVFHRLANDAELECKTNPHAFRKGRATNMASQGMNQAQLCEYFGWVQGSDQAATYIRMADKDLDKAVKQIHGLEEDEEETESLEPIVCTDCGERNPGHRDNCKECGELISRDKEVIVKMKEDEVVNEVKNDLVDELFDRAGFTEEEKQELMNKKMDEKMGGMDFFEDVARVGGD